MPKELVKPFLKQGRRTRKQYVVLAVLTTIALRLGMPSIIA